MRGKLSTTLEQIQHGQHNFLAYWESAFVKQYAKFATFLHNDASHQLHEIILTRFGLSDKRYGLNQLCYDLRKLRAHALLERDGNRYAYRLTDEGVKVALLFVLLHQRLCGPLANSLFHHRRDAAFQPNRKLEAAVQKADNSIRKVIEFLEAT